MATIYLSLSAKTDKATNQHEILIRFKHGAFAQRAKSNIFIQPEYWNNEPVLNMITDIYKVKSKEFIKNKDGVHSKQSIYDQPNNKRFKIRDRVIGFFNIFWNKRKTLGDGDSRYIIH